MTTVALPDSDRDLQPEQARALQLLAHRFPKIPIWFGHATRNWWAMVGGRLIEATTPEELGRLLDYAQPQPERGRPARRTDSSPGVGSGGPPSFEAAERETAPIPAMRALSRTAAPPPPRDRWRPAARPSPAPRAKPPRRLSPRRRNIGSWVPALGW